MTIGLGLAEFGWRGGPTLPQSLTGRDYDASEMTAIFPVTVGADGEVAGELTEELRRWAASGSQTAIGILSGSDPVRQVEIIGEKAVAEV